MGFPRPSPFDRTSILWGQLSDQSREDFVTGLTLLSVRQKALVEKASDDYKVYAERQIASDKAKKKEEARRRRLRAEENRKLRELFRLKNYY